MANKNVMALFLVICLLPLAWGSTEVMVVAKGGNETSMMVVVVNKDENENGKTNVDLEKDGKLSAAFAQTHLEKRGESAAENDTNKGGEEKFGKSSVGVGLARNVTDDVKGEDDEGEAPSFCRNLSHPHPDQEYIKNVVFWVEGVALSLCGTAGIIGNVLTCVVLAKISLNNVFNQLIVMLCSFDTLFNAIAILEYSLKKAFALLSYSTPVYVNLWPKFIYPFQNITYSASLCITMAIAVERYLAVCHPFFVHQDSALSSGGGGGYGSSAGHFFKKRTLRYLLPALTFAVIINIPKFFEFRNFVTEDNTTYIQPTEIRLDNTYQVYYISWTRTILHAFLPFILLAVLNGRIIHQIWKAEKIAARAMNRSIDRRDNHHHSNGNSLQSTTAVVSTTSSSSSKREAKLARILVLLVFSFLVCNLGKLVINIFDLDQLANIKVCEQLGMEFLPPRWVPTLLSLNHLLIVTNASTNLVLFSLIGTQFRATLLAILHLRKAPGRSAHRRDGSPTNDAASCVTTNHRCMTSTNHSYRVTMATSSTFGGTNNGSHRNHHNHHHLSAVTSAVQSPAEEHEMTNMLKV